jgi:Dolichyl-phosphate-mannose-protein mannosyltransferase
MHRAIDRAWHSPRTVYAACAISLTIGLFFIFVWAPHPWGREGFDHYHDIAIALARGGAFPTMEVPWAYAYFVAAFYRMFGVRPWIPLTAQAALNTLTPLLVFALARRWCDRRTAVLASVLTGIFSFNTIYASTESSDAVCTVIFLTAIVAFIRGLDEGGLGWFAITGILGGLAPQFRPNLILIPPLLAAYTIWMQRTRRAAAHAAVLLACTGVMLAPWVVRNYRLTGLVLPTSVHGGVQLWYGTLQVGPALQSRARNIRSVFEAPAFEYTSLDQVPIVVEGQLNCTEEVLDEVVLAYWSDHDGTERRLSPVHVEARHYTFEIPAVRTRAVIYYYFVTKWSGASHTTRTTPPAGRNAPFVYFVSDDHLGDLDVHGDLLDVFDVARLLRRQAWHEAIAGDERLLAAGATDASAAAAILLPVDAAHTAVAGVHTDEATARITFRDGSSMAVPRRWSGRITDLAFTEGSASTLMTSHVPFRALAARTSARVSSVEACTQVTDIGVNQVFYRREPHLMGRYSALAFDNIRRDPAGFALATAYRAVRLFLIQGTPDKATAQQFQGSRRVYAAATVISTVYLALLVIGIVVGWRRGYRVGLPLLLIAYVPATLAPVLTNMRYTVTVQPLMFIFMAIAISALTSIARGDAAMERIG